MSFENLPPELKARARECQTPEDVLALAKAEGYELTDEELEAVSGGDMWDCLADGCDQFLNSLPD